MKTATTPLLAVLLVLAPVCTRAQALRPTVLIQPGMTSADFFSAPKGEPSTTGFSLRFAGVIPSTSRWWTLIVGAHVTPNGSSGASRRNTNTPALFVGNLFPLVDATTTNGWLSIDVPVLMTYSYEGGRSGNKRIYGTDLVVQAAFTAHVGDKLLHELGDRLGRLRAYAYVEHLLTPNRDVVSRAIDRFNPVVHYGLTIPFGEGRHSP